jgi:hypothetical protein
MLCDTKEEIESLNPNDLVRYSYIVLFDLGTYSEKITASENAIIRANFARFMYPQKERSALVVPVKTLDEVSKEAPIRAIIHPFNPLPNLNAYLAVASTDADPSNPERQYYSEPLNVDEGVGSFPYAYAVGNTLARLETKLCQSSIEELIQNTRS